MRTLGIGAASAAVALCLVVHPSVRAADAPPAAPGATPAGAPSAGLEGARGNLDKWVETQQIISREKKDWQQARELLTSRIQLVKSEIAELRTSLEETHRNEQEFQKSLSESEGEREDAKSVSGELAKTAGELEGKVRSLYKAMPESLREKIQPLYDRMPPDAETAKVTVAERYQNILGILNEMNRLNGEITLASEIRSLSDGKPSEVKTVYLGLGQAWYLSARGEAGVGQPGPDGWKWRPAPEVATEVGQMLEILQNKMSPKFIPLPVTIQ